MWTLGIFFAIIGFMRGPRREIVVSAGLVLALFAIFQFDSILRGTIFLAMPAAQVFVIEAGFYLAIAFIVYQAEDISGSDRREEGDWQAGILGAFVGFVNGYLIGGSIWYFLDINEYPLEQWVTAPAVGSPSAQSLGVMPMMLLGGGASGTGDVLAIGVIILLIIVLFVV
jgi:hypothetical protein